MGGEPSESTRSLTNDVNAASEARLREFLTACCDVPAWVETVAYGRPYADDAALLAEADAAARTFGADDVDRALAAHPRIGERASGDSPGARWSREEQSGVPAGDGSRIELAEVNRRYEERFGRVLLICASGLSAEQILDTARTRLANCEEDERTVVADELRKIALVRLRKKMPA